MTTWIEPPPKQKGMGCLGKGCLLIVVLLVLLVIAFFIGGYAGIRYVVTSSEPKEIPQVQTSEEEQKAVRARWNEFESVSRNRQVSPPSPVVPGLSPAPDVTPASANRIELTANDINQLIAGSRNVRGKAYVTLDNNVARIQVSIPLEKMGFQGRFLNGEFAVRSPADRNPRNLEVTQVSLAGGAASEAVLKALLGSRSVHSYVDEYATEWGVATLSIEDGKVIIETNRGR